MKLLFDLFPVIFFFASFKLGESHRQAAADLVSPPLLLLFGSGTQVTLDQAPILLATLVVIVATALQIAWVKLRHGRVDRMLWVSFALVTFFGGLTLALRDPSFIKWKPTILYWIFSAALLISSTLMKKNLIRAMLQQQITLPDGVWQQLNIAWALFFALLGAANLYVAFNYPLGTWADFKLFGVLGMMMAFFVVQGLYLARYIEADK